jgi:hypothetical protein
MKAISIILITVALAGCWGDDKPAPAPTETPAPAPTPSATP